MTPQSSPWQIDGDRALLQAELLQTQIDLRNPSAGLANVVYDGLSMKHFHVLQMTPEGSTGDPDPLADRYVRGDDLVAAYAPSPPGTASCEVYWRALGRPERVAGIELVVSTQTNHLLSDSRVTNRSVMPASEIWSLDHARSAFAPLDLSDSPPWTGTGPNTARTFLFRSSQYRASYLEMVSTADVERTMVFRPQDAPSCIELSYQLFPEPLEKGVIRRVRIRGLLLPRENDLALARECSLEMSAASPPLTA